MKLFFRQYVIRFFGVNDFLPTNALLTKIGREACEARSPYQVICSNVLFMITGYDASLLNVVCARCDSFYISLIYICSPEILIDQIYHFQTTIPIILGHVPAGSSIKQFFHYAQGHNSSKRRGFFF